VRDFDDCEEIGEALGESDCFLYDLGIIEPYVVIDAVLVDLDRFGLGLEMLKSDRSEMSEISDISSVSLGIRVFLLDKARDSRVFKVLVEFLAL